MKRVERLIKMNDKTRNSGVKGAEKVRGVRYGAWIHAEEAKDEADGAFI